MRRPTLAARTYTAQELTAMTLDTPPPPMRTTRLHGVAYVAVTDVVRHLDRHSARWDVYALDVDNLPTTNPLDLAEEDTRAATVTGAYHMADELTRRASELSRLEAEAVEPAPVLTADPDGLKIATALLLGVCGGLATWLALAALGWVMYR